MKKYKYFRKIVLTNKERGVIINSTKQKRFRKQKVSKRRIPESKI